VYIWINMTLKCSGYITGDTSIKHTSQIHKGGIKTKQGITAGMTLVQTRNLQHKILTIFKSGVLSSTFSPNVAYNVFTLYCFSLLQHIQVISWFSWCEILIIHRTWIIPQYFGSKVCTALLRNPRLKKQLPTKNETLK